MSSSDPRWPIKKLDLFPPGLDDLAMSIAAGLESNFEVSSAKVEPCPDLRLPPYHLAAEGLSGKRRIADVGGQANLAPNPDLSKKYDILSVARAIGMSPNKGFLFGAGAGPFHILGTNSELMPNLSYDEEGVQNLTRYAKITENGGVRCERISQDNTGFGLMANFYSSDGARGLGLHVKASSRTGNLNFTDSIQKALKDAYGDRLISLGGVFVIKRGKANLHVMPGFPAGPFRDRKDVEEWLRYFDTEAPITCLCVLHTGNDQGLELRMEHTHCFSGDRSGSGGHYHNDLDETMGVVEYEGWFNTAEVLYRIDQPGNTGQQRL